MGQAMSHPWGVAGLDSSCLSVPDGIIDGGLLESLSFLPVVTHHSGLSSVLLE